MHWLKKSSNPKAKEKEFTPRLNIESGKQVSVCNLLMNYYAKRVMLKNDLEALNLQLPFEASSPLGKYTAVMHNMAFFHR